MQLCSSSTAGAAVSGCTWHGAVAGARQVHGALAADEALRAARALAGCALAQPAADDVEEQAAQARLGPPPPPVAAAALAPAGQTEHRRQAIRHGKLGSGPAASRRWSHGMCTCDMPSGSCRRRRHQRVFPVPHCIDGITKQPPRAHCSPAAAAATIGPLQLLSPERRLAADDARVFVPRPAGAAVQLLLHARVRHRLLHLQGDRQAAHVLSVNAWLPVC